MHYQQERTYGCRISDAWTYRGLKTAIVENEILRVVVLVDKGADIYQLVHKPTDVDFLWRSPWGVRDPTRFLPTSGWPAGVWLDVYEGGWQTVLPGGGYPSNYNGVELGLHAEVNTIPWDAAIVEDSPQQVSLRCWVRTYRTPFYAEKTLTLKAGSPMLEIQETLVNEGEESAMCVWGQHIALGAPFLSEDCILDLPGGTVLNHPTEWHPNNRLKPGFQGEWPWSQAVDGSQVDMRQIPPRSARVTDMAYFTDLPEGWYAVTNRKLNLGFGVVFPQDIFRYLWYWQVFGGGYGYPWYGRTYNVGLEPFTSYSNQGLQSAVDNGTALRLEAGQSVTVNVKALAFTGARGVERIQPDGTVIPRG